MNLKEIVQRLEAIEDLPADDFADDGSKVPNYEIARQVFRLRLDIERYLLLHGGQQ